MAVWSSVQKVEVSTNGQNGINPVYVIAGFWINAGRDIDPLSPTNEREQINEEYRRMVVGWLFK
jgi:hypothetical protein